MALPPSSQDDNQRALVVVRILYFVFFAALGVFFTFIKM